MRALLAVTLLLAACETPPLTIKFRLTDGPSQQCIGENGGNPTTDCKDISLECQAVLSIRIVPPNEPDVPYVSVCEALSLNQNKLCAIAGVDLPQPAKPVPEQTLEVQMAVFPRSAVPEGPDGKLQCPAVEFGVNNLPVMQANCTGAESDACLQRPAVGGRAFYHPGDEETIIELGCTELELLRGEQCNDIDRTDVIATVTELDAPGLEVAPSRLFVSIGEPVPSTAMSYALDSSRTHLIPRDLAAQLPTWSDRFVDLGFLSSYCIEVLEDAPMATRTLTCRPLPLSYPEKIDATGTRLEPETLATILKAANLTTFPSKGIVVGIVLSNQFAPVAGAVVKTSCGMSPSCTVKYLSEDKLSFTGTSTSSNGIWISQDAPYGTLFGYSEQIGETYGGLVDNKVTIVVLQESGIGN